MRAPTREYDAVIIGAGFSGLYMLYALRNLGLRCRVFEAGGGVGGSWYWNRYPGARCDSESYFYCYSFSEQVLQEWTWSERFPAQPEIERYLNFVADRLDLRKDIRFETRVVAAAYDEASLHWTVETDGGDKVEARYVVTAIGGLTSTAANVPAVPGLEDFTGEWHHTGRWPKLGVDLSGKRVGVIGTGSTGIQAIPVIAEQATELTVFQRTPAYIMPARNAPLDPEYIAAIKANYAEIWRKAKAHRGGQPYDPPALAFADAEESEARRLQEEYWARGGLRVVQLFNDLYSNPECRAFTEAFFREKVRQIVNDSAAAEILEPKGYPIGAKRIALDTNYYETFNLPHVRVVDARKNPISRITPAGIRAGEAEYPLDIIVFATGYDAVTGPFRAIDIRGRGGVRLADRLADGPRAYLGMSFAGFPNLLAVSGPCNPALSTNVPVSIEHDVEWIADAIDYCERNGIRAIEPTERAEEAWTEDTQAKIAGTVFEQADSWQFGSNVPGKPRRFLLWLGGLTAFREKCSAVVRAGYEGFTLQRRAAAREDEMTNATIEQRLQRLEDFEAIKRLCIDLSNCLDGRDLKGYGALFTEDGEWSGIVGRAVGPAAITEILGKYCLPWESEGHRTYHTTVDIVIDIDGDTAKATSKWQHIKRSETDAPMIWHLGHYDDRLRRTPHGWRFTRRAAYADIPYVEPRYQLIGLACADPLGQPVAPTGTATRRG